LQIIAAGLRIGWASGPKKVMQKLFSVHLAKVVGTCQMSQVTDHSYIMILCRRYVFLH